MQVNTIFEIISLTLASFIIIGTLLLIILRIAVCVVVYKLRWKEEVAQKNYWEKCEYIKKFTRSGSTEKSSEFDDT